MDVVKQNLIRWFNWHNTLLGLVVLLALIVRVYGIGFPLYHWDEGASFGDVFYAVGYNLGMFTYEHGSFLTYLLILIWTPILAVTHNTFPGLYEFFITYYQNPLLLAIPGRLISTFASVGTVLSVYFLGKRLYHRTVGLAAAFLLALTFLDVSEAHYMRTYALTSLFSTLAVFFCIKILDEPRLRNYVLAGLSIGLATAAQYIVIFLVVPLVTAHVIVTWREWGSAAWRHLLSKDILAGLDSAGLAFFLVTPYALLEFRDFSGYMKWYLLNPASGVSPEGQPVWLFYLTQHLGGGMGIELEIVAIIGVAFALCRRHSQDFVLLEFPILLFITLNSRPGFARYAVPLLPFLTTAAASLLYSLSQSFSRWAPARISTLALVLATVGLAIPSALNVVRFDFWITQPDTRALAAMWIQENVPPGTKITTEGADILGPYIPPEHSKVEMAIARAQTEYHKQQLKAMEVSLAGRPGYKLTPLFRLDRGPSGSVDDPVPSAQVYADQGLIYLLTVNWMKRSADDGYSPEFQQSLDAFYEPIAEIRPTVVFGQDPYAFRMDYDALARVVPGVAQVGGPLFTIYRRKGAQP